MCVRVYVCVCAYTCVYVIYMCVRVHVCVCAYTRLHVIYMCVRVHVCVCEYTCVYVVYMYIHVYICVYVYHVQISRKGHGRSTGGDTWQLCPDQLVEKKGGGEQKTRKTKNSQLCSDFIS